MRNIELDGRRMDTRAQAHAYLQKALALPDYYGKNLDALHDCLGEMSGVAIDLHHAAALLNALGQYGRQLIAVFRQQAQQRDDFHFRLSEKE